MNRRNFFKTVSITLAGILLTLKTKRILKCKWNGAMKCGGQNNTLCFRCKYEE